MWWISGMQTVFSETGIEEFAKELEAIGKREHDPPFDPKVFR
jgi:hypothetical protein